MIEIIVTDRNGVAAPIQAQEGQSLMQAIRFAGFESLLALCGGCCSCATCHVYVDNAYMTKVSPLSACEDDLLEASTERMANSRLACQVRVTESLDRMGVRIAPE